MKLINELEKIAEEMADASSFLEQSRIEINDVIKNSGKLKTADGKFFCSINKSGEIIIEMEEFVNENGETILRKKEFKELNPIILEEIYKNLVETRCKISEIFVSLNALLSKNKLSKELNPRTVGRIQTFPPRLRITTENYKMAEEWIKEKTIFLYHVGQEAEIRIQQGNRVFTELIADIRKAIADNTERKAA